MTCSVYATVAVAFDRYVEMTDGLSTYKWLKNGIVQCLIILAFSIIFNITRWFELEYVNYYQMENSTNILANDTEEFMEKNVSKVSLQVTKNIVTKQLQMQCTDFSIIHILREINSGESRSYKAAIFCNFKGSEFCQFGAIW